MMRRSGKTSRTRRHRRRSKRADDPRGDLVAKLRPRLGADSVDGGREGALDEAEPEVPDPAGESTALGEDVAEGAREADELGVRDYERRRELEDAQVVPRDLRQHAVLLHERGRDHL